jgi:three-Cys-motif partner protein
LPKKPKKYNWRELDNLPMIQDHSVAKHRVLEFYLERYIRVMTADPRRPLMKIHLIDGFAGGGKYVDEMTGMRHDGSPLIFLKTVERLEKEIRATRKKNFRIDAHYYFVEKETQVFKFLKELLVREGYNHQIDKNITLIKGTFVEVLAKLLSIIKSSGRSPRCIFLLDQYGYSDVPIQQLRLIFSTLPTTAEVLLTFASDTLINYMAENEPFKKVLEKSGLTDVINDDIIRSFRESPKNETKEARLAIEQLLATEILIKSRARFFTPFFITSAKSNRSYLLVHLSNHVKARDEMNKTHWELKNHFHHYGDAGLNNMLGFDPKKDIGEQLLLDYCFDDEAEARTYDALLEDIPRLVTSPESITFGSLLMETCNNTPANSEHYKKVLARLVAEKVIQITSDDGKHQRLSSNTIKNSDIITPCRQFNLFI